MDVRDDLKKKNLNKLLDFVASSFPGTGGASGVSLQEISKTLISDNKVFLKIILPLIIGWTLLLAMQFIAYLLLGPSDCSGNPGPFIPSFFCSGDQKTIPNALSRFVSTTFWFVVVVELLLLFFYAMVLFARTKYNVTIPKPLTLLFWFFVAGVFLTFLGLMVFG